MTLISPRYKPGDKIRVTYWIVPRTDGWHNGVFLKMVSPDMALVDWGAGGVSTINLSVIYSEKQP